MSGITLVDDTVVFSKRHWFMEELAVGESLGFRFRDDKFTADLLKTSKPALFNFMKYCFGKFVKDEEFKEERVTLYKELSKKYGDIFNHIEEHLHALPYYHKLYRHQAEAIAQMISVKDNLLAFEQGLGKTVTAISVSEVMGLNKTLIVCPAICKWNWYNELKQWGININQITVYDSKKKNIIVSGDERYIIINYDMLKKYEKLLCIKNFKHIILDEAHYVKNPNSKRYKFVSKIVHSCKPKLSLLTGTPVWNKPEDIYAYLKLTKHTLGRNYRNFVEQYTHYYANGWGGLNIIKGKNLYELSTKISNFMIRKLKSQCLDLPDKIYTKYYFDFLDYSEEYTDVINGIKEREEIRSADGSIHTLNIISAKSKMKNIIELTEEILYSGKKVVLFTSYSEPRVLLENHFGSKAVSVYGGQSSEFRQKQIDKFTDDDSCRVFIGNMQAAGVGINLYVASDVIFCNFPLTVSELQQCIDRLHRIGQANNVNVYYTISKGSVDESIYDMIIKKSDDIKKVIDGGKETIQLETAYSELISNAIGKWKKG